MNLEHSFFNKLETEKQDVKKDRMLYAGLGCILCCVVISGYILYQLTFNPTNPVLARDTVVLLFLFGLSLITVWMIEP